jgi:Formyl transferase
VRTVLIYHDDAALDRHVVAPWLGSFSELAALVIIREPKRNTLVRIRRELRRSGFVRFFDVLAYRLYFRLVLAKRDREWEAGAQAALGRRFSPLPHDLPVLLTHDPNGPQVERFIREHRPDLMVARCRVLLAEEIFSIPPLGTFVMHPGITPEYRNSHGCFWALVNRDFDRVGLTLLRIDAGVDTGPVYGYFSYDYDERRDSHETIQKRMFLENLDALRDRLLEIERGQAEPLDTSDRASAVWGQPWLSRYLRWKREVRRTGR